MAELPDVRFGTADAEPLDWRKFEDPGADDDEELATTPPSVVKLLGFDPLDITETAGDVEMPRPDAEGTPADVAALMEMRSFGPERKDQWDANLRIYSRHDGGITLYVRFHQGKVVTATCNLAPNERDSGSEASHEVRQGFKGLYSFAQAYGD